MRKEFNVMITNDLYVRDGAEPKRLATFKNLKKANDYVEQFMRNVNYETSIGYKDLHTTCYIQTEII